MLILYLIEVMFAFCLSGSDATIGQHVTTNNISCVCVCYKIISCHEKTYGKIIWNISDYIRPIRLRNIAGDLAGQRVRVSGWGRTSDG